MATEVFEFIDCSTINIQYQVVGLATVSFTIVSTEQLPGTNPVRDYTQLSFGGIEFKGFITQVDSSIIVGSTPTVFEHKLTISATGCAADCPRG